MFKDYLTNVPYMYVYFIIQYIFKCLVFTISKLKQSAKTDNLSLKTSVFFNYHYYTEQL